MMVTIVLASIVAYIFVATFVYKIILIRFEVSEFDDWHYMVSIMWPIALPICGVFHMTSILVDLFSDLFDKVIR